MRTVRRYSGRTEAASVGREWLLLEAHSTRTRLDTGRKGAVPSVSSKAIGDAGYRSARWGFPLRPKRSSRSIAETRGEIKRSWLDAQGPEAGQVLSVPV